MVAQIKDDRQRFLADHTDGRAIGTDFTVLRLSSVCNVMYVLWLNGAS